MWEWVLGGACGVKGGRVSVDAELCENGGQHDGERYSRRERGTVRCRERTCGGDERELLMQPRIQEAGCIGQSKNAMFQAQHGPQVIPVVSASHFAAGRLHTQKPPGARSATRSAQWVPPSNCFSHQPASAYHEYPADLLAYPLRRRPIVPRPSAVPPARRPRPGQGPTHSRSSPWRRRASCAGQQRPRPMTVCWDRTSR